MVTSHSTPQDEVPLARQLAVSKDKIYILQGINNDLTSELKNANARIERWQLKKNNHSPMCKMGVPFLLLSFLSLLGCITTVSIGIWTPHSQYQESLFNTTSLLGILAFVFAVAGCVLRFGVHSEECVQIGGPRRGY